MWSRFVLLGCVLLLSACTAEPEFQQIAGVTPSTTYHVMYWTETPIEARSIETEIEKVLENIDITLSNANPEAVIEKFNTNPTTVPQEVGAELVKLVNIAQTVSQLSQGCIDVTFRPVFELWGFNSDVFKTPDQTAIQAALEQVGMSKLVVVDATHLKKQQANITVDVSSIISGYRMGKVSELLDEFGIHNYKVEIGGELQTKGHRADGKPWVIAVEKPLPGERRLHKVISMPKDTTMSVLTSGTYHSYFDANGQRYSHVLDTRTGKLVTHNVVAVMVLHENPVVANVWSSALLCLGYQDGLKLANSEKINAIFIRQQDSELLETQSNSLRITNNLTIQ